MWIKKGLIYSDSHAQLPTVELGENIRIFFSQKTNNKSCINYIEVDRTNPSRILYKNTVPILGPGERGCFDDAGVMPSCIVGNDLYYTGWNTNKGDVPYGHGIGIATRSGNVFVRRHLGPILDRSVDDPFLCNSPCLVDDLIYYCSGTGWDGNLPYYQIACRKNGEKFICIANNNIAAMSRPFVVKDNVYKMWFCCKYKEIPYEMYYAESKDGLGWELKEGAVIKRSASGWDSEMICYPYVISVDEKRYMFYNGNGYGASGIGYAEWE